MVWNGVLIPVGGSGVGPTLSLSGGTGVCEAYGRGGLCCKGSGAVVMERRGVGPRRALGAYLRGSQWLRGRKLRLSSVRGVQLGLLSTAVRVDM